MKMLFRFIKNIKSFWKFYKDYEYNGEDCEFIVDNYQEVLCSRTRTMSKPTYRASAVIAEIDEWYNESLKLVYGCEPIENAVHAGGVGIANEECFVHIALARIGAFFQNGGAVLVGIDRILVFIIAAVRHKGFLGGGGIRCVIILPCGAAQAAPDLGSGAVRRVGSSPIIRTKNKL